MADIAGCLEQLMNARYGKDVRQSIHDSIQAINEQVEAGGGSGDTFSIADGRLTISGSGSATVTEGRLKL